MHDKTPRSSLNSVRLWRRKSDGNEDMHRQISDEAPGPASQVSCVFVSNSGSLVMFTAIRRASFYQGGDGTNRNHDHYEQNDLRDDA